MATITLNRPAARNALTAETKTALLAALRRCGSDAGVRAVILTGAGRAFCAGQDLREHAGLLEAGAAAGRHGAGALQPDHDGDHHDAQAGGRGGERRGRRGRGVAGVRLRLPRSPRAGASLLMAFARVGLGADSGASWTLQRLAGPAGPPSC